MRISSPTHVSPWASYLTALCLSFPEHKIELIITIYLIRLGKWKAIVHRKSSLRYWAHRKNSVTINVFISTYKELARRILIFQFFHSECVHHILYQGHHSDSALREVNWVLFSCILQKRISLFKGPKLAPFYWQRKQGSGMWSRLF